MEWSFVPIGSNPDCLRSELAAGRIGKHILNPVTLKMLGVERYVPKSWSITLPSELHRSDLQSQSKKTLFKQQKNNEGNVPEPDTNNTPQVPPGQQFAQELLQAIGGIFDGVKNGIGQVEQPDVRKATLSICAAMEPAIAEACAKLKEIYPELELPENPELDYGELEKADDDTEPSQEPDNE
jgi:hypothetical protein